MQNDRGVSWARALTLTERTALGSEPRSGDGERSAKRLRRWKLAHDLEENGGLAALLGTIAGGEPTLAALLGESASSLAERAGDPPAWWVSLPGGEADAQEHPDPDSPAYWVRGFARVTAPLVRQAVGHLARTLIGCGSVEQERVLEEFAAELARDLVSIAARTLILELNVRRVQGKLTGSTGPERFWAFTEEVSSPEGMAVLFGEYPVLARLLARRAETAVAAAAEFFTRWEADRDLVVSEIFGGADPGPLVQAGFGKGDPHQGGRSVAVVRFASGASVVYKPRPLAVHARFNYVLEWFDPQLRRLRVLDRGGYGWVEFAEHAECADAEGISRYYERLGKLMALLYVLDGADFHFENLLAAGDQPVLVDLETLFHQQLPVTAGQALASDPALWVLESSVVRLGVLPILVSTADGAVDLGGLGGDPSASTPYSSATWDGGGTDEMRVVRRNLEFAGGQNRPSAAGVAADPASFLPSLLAGFSVGYQRIAARTEEFSALLPAFADVQVRSVLRTTQVYLTLLNEGSHPDHLRDALDRDRHFSLLWNASAGSAELARVVPDELADLWNGDVPLFVSRPGSRDLWTSRRQRLPEYYPKPGLDRVREKLQTLGEADLRRQEWVIRASLVTRPGAVTVLREPAPRTMPALPAVPTADYVTAATAIGDRISELSIHDGQGRAGWLGLDLADQATWRVAALRWDLYSGFSGVAMFLSALSRQTGVARYQELGQRSLWAVPALLAEFEAAPSGRLATVPNLNGLTGLPGLAYALTHLGDPDTAERVARLCGELVDGDESLDVLSGSAGTIAAMLAMRGSTLALDVAKRCGERLLARAEPAGDGIAWRTMDAKRPLTGFGHGSAGIGWALIKLGVATGDERFVHSGLAAFRQERGEYRAEWANWPDYRDIFGDGEAGHMFAWCHGAPGIGLARAGALAALGHGDEYAPLRDDLALALATTQANGFGQGHSLCHGDLGNAELLLAAGLPTEPVAAQVLATPPRCGTPAEVETPSLMIGLAGIGYGLLRLASPETVPSVLLVQGPLA